MPDKKLVEFIINASRSELQSSLLQRLAAEANARKQIRDLLENWIEEAAHARLLQWIDEHGAEFEGIIELPRPRELKSAALPAQPFPLPKKPPSRARHLLPSIRKKA